MIAPPELGQFALLLLFLPAALAMVVGMLLLRRARGEQATRRARLLGGAGIGLGALGLLTIVSAFVQMVGKNPALLLPYSMREGGGMLQQASQVLPAPEVPAQPAWEARAVLAIEGPLWEPQDPAADSLISVPFSAELGRNARLVRNASLLLRAGEIAGRPGGAEGTTWMDVVAARKLLQSVRDPVLRSDHVQIQYANEIMTHTRLEQEGTDTFVVVARCGDPARAAAVAAAVAGAIVHTDAEDVRAGYRRARQMAELNRSNREAELKRERTRLVSWQREPNLSQDVPRVEARIRELEAEVVEAQAEVARNSRLAIPDKPRVHVLRWPGPGELVGDY